MKILEQVFNWELEPLEINEPIYSELEQSDIEIYKLKNYENNQTLKILKYQKKEKMLFYT